MTGDHNEGKTAPRQRTEWPDELELVGPGPTVVYNQSRKMSIYGPKFLCGPPQLRKQRLWTKMKDEAEAAMAERTAQLVSEDEQEKKRKEEKKLKKAVKSDKSEEESVRKVGVVFNHHQAPQSQNETQKVQQYPLQQYQPQQHAYYHQYQAQPYQDQQYHNYNYNQFQDYHQYQQEFHQYPLVHQYPEHNAQYATNQF